MAQRRNEQRIEQVKRTIHYYELNYTAHPDYPNPAPQNAFVATMRKITQMAVERNERRYLQILEKSIFVQDIAFDGPRAEIIGKISSINKNVFPEIQNTLDDTRRGIEAAEQEGIVETSHFIIKYGRRLRIGIEHNYQGAKILDFCNYVQRIGSNNEFLTSVTFIPIVSGDLAGTIARIKRCSEIKVRVHRDFVAQVEEVDEGLYTALNTLTEQFNTEYASLAMKFNYRNVEETAEASGLIEKLGRLFRLRPETMSIFEMVEVKAEDSAKNNRIEAFDLLVDKLKSKVFVQKTPRYRTIVSDDMYDKIRSEMNTLNV
jgi:hypothetical protein